MNKKFRSVPVCVLENDSAKYAIERYNDITKEYEPIKMKPWTKESIEELVKELNNYYEEDCKCFENIGKR